MVGTLPFNCGRIPSSMYRPSLQRLIALLHPPPPCVENGEPKYFKASKGHLCMHEYNVSTCMHTIQSKPAAPTQQAHVVDATSEPSQSIMGPRHSIVDLSHEERAGPLPSAAAPPGLQSCMHAPLRAFRKTWLLFAQHLQFSTA